jgi:hypothetical protein
VKLTSSMRKFFILLVFIAGLFTGFMGVFPTVFLPSMLQVRLVHCESLSSQEKYLGSKIEHCYNDTLVDMVKQFGLKSSVETVRGYMKSSSGSLLEGQRCHALAHEIGNAAAKTNISPYTLLSECTDMCKSKTGVETVSGLDLGCANGAAHTWVLLGKSVESAVENCNGSNMPDNIQEGCFHGIGHGLIEKYGGNIVEAVSDCIKLPSPNARYQCAHAIFMSTSARMESGGRFASTVSYCDSLPSDIRQSCFEFAGFIAYFQTKQAPDVSITCNQIAGEMRRFCLQRGGEALYLSRNDTRDIGNCFFVDDEAVYDCIIGFVRVSVDNVNDYFGSDAYTACHMIPFSHQGFCFGQTGIILEKRYGKDVRRKFCDDIKDKRLSSACHEAIE